MAGAFISHLLLTGMVTTQVGADETYSLEAIYVTIVVESMSFYLFVVSVEESMSIKLLLWYIRKMTWINANVLYHGFTKHSPWFIVLRYYV